MRDLPDLLGATVAGVHPRGVLGDTPLHVAAVRGDARMVGLLLDAGAQIDARGARRNARKLACLNSGNEPDRRALIPLLAEANSQLWIPLQYPPAD